MQTSRIFIDAYTGETFEAKVEAIRPPMGDCFQVVYSNSDGTFTRSILSKKHKIVDGYVSYDFREDNLEVNVTSLVANYIFREATLKDGVPLIWCNERLGAITEFGELLLWTTHFKNNAEMMVELTSLPIETVFKGSDRGDFPKSFLYNKLNRNNDTRYFSYNGETIIPMSERNDSK